MRPILFKYESASAKLIYIDAGTCMLVNVYSLKRGLGHAKGVLQEVIDYADEYGATIILIAQSSPRSSLTNKQLEELYSRFGFKTTRRGPTRMIRHPRE